MESFGAVASVSVAARRKLIPIAKLIHCPSESNWELHDGDLLSFRWSEHGLFFRLDPEMLFLKSGSEIHRRYSDIRLCKESKSANVRRDA
jgi:hypothetical protein